MCNNGDDMNIIVGSTNLAKVKAVEEIFPNEHVFPKQVASHVSEQPFSDEETREGAINRALQCVSTQLDHVIGIGLEGGVMYIGDQLYLCNWGALVTETKDMYIASGARILLPPTIAEPLKEGIELGKVMAAYTQNKDVRHHEGAVGVLTNNLVSRKEMFIHVVKLLRGQWEFSHL